MPQFAGAYENQRRQAQGTANRQRSFVPIDRAHAARPARLGSVMAAKCVGLNSGEGAAQIAGRVAFGAAGRDRRSGTPGRSCRAPDAPSPARRAFRCACTVVSSSGAVISAIGRAPIHGNMSRSNRVRIRSPWPEPRFSLCARSTRAQPPRSCSPRRPSARLSQRGGSRWDQRRRRAAAAPRSCAARALFKLTSG